MSFLANLAATGNALELGIGTGRIALPLTQRVSSHLEPGGYFVIEVLVPELQRLPPGETVRAFTVTSTHLSFDEYDVVAQRVVFSPLLGGQWPT